MRIFKYFALVILTGIAVAGMTVSSARAAILDVVGGELQGATGVVVGGSIYNVVFTGGTCFTNYITCDGTTVFDFNDSGSAEIAAQALLDQVFRNPFGGPFDTNPELTAGGCTDEGVALTGECIIVVPYLFNPSIIGSEVFAQSVRNFSGLVSDQIVDLSFNKTGVANSFSAFARFTEVSVIPLPPAAYLFGTALVGLAGLRRRRQRQA